MTDRQIATVAITKAVQCIAYVDRVNVRVEALERELQEAVVMLTELATVMIQWQAERAD